MWQDLWESGVRELLCSYSTMEPIGLFLRRYRLYTTKGLDWIRGPR